jgi:hypothetical protein
MAERTRLADKIVEVPEVEGEEDLAEEVVIEEDSRKASQTTVEVEDLETITMVEAMVEVEEEVEDVAATIGHRMAQRLVASTTEVQVARWWNQKDVASLVSVRPKTPR